MPNSIDQNLLDAYRDEKTKLQKQIKNRIIRIKWVARSPFWGCAFFGFFYLIQIEGNSNRRLDGLILTLAACLIYSEFFAYLIYTAYFKYSQKHNAIIDLLRHKIEVVDKELEERKNEAERAGKSANKTAYSRNASNPEQKNTTPKDKNRGESQQLSFPDSLGLQKVDRPLVSVQIGLFDTPGGNSSDGKLGLFEYLKSISDQSVSVDYLQLNEHKTKVGILGELFVLQIIKDGLVQLGRDDLANKTIHFSKDKGDRFGFDILTYASDGTEIIVEVKTTVKDRNEPFFLTASELGMASKGISYCIYRVFDFDIESEQGNYFKITKDQLFEEWDITPTSFKVSLKR